MERPDSSPRYNLESDATLEQLRARRRQLADRIQSLISELENVERELESVNNELERRRPSANQQ